MYGTAAHVRIHHVAGRSPGGGPVIAVLTDGPTDLAVAARAAALAARHGTLLIAAATVHTPRFSINALLHHTRRQRLHAQTTAIVARVTPILHTAGIAYTRTTLTVPSGTDPLRALPVGAVHRLINRFHAVAVVTAGPVHDPTGTLQPHPTGQASPARTPG
jgi:hypothetical protein